MSDVVIDPKKYPEQAALQVVIELIRAQRVGMQSHPELMKSLFDGLNAHFKELSALPPIDFDEDAPPY